MGCIAYIRMSDNKTLHTCQMCKDLPEKDSHMSIEGEMYMVYDIVKDITNGEESVTIYLK